MNIVVIDAVAMSNQQKRQLESMGNLRVYSDLAEDPEAVISRCRDAEVVISGWTTFSEEVLKELKTTQLISLWSTGYDQIDLQVAKACGITVTNVRGYAKNAVAEMAFGLMLAVYRKIVLSDNDVKVKGNYDWHPFLGRELTGKTIGIIGYGAIGQKVARIAAGFDMRVLGHRATKQSGLENGVHFKSKEDLLRESDIVSLHLPLVAETEHYINKTDLAMMKPGSILINTARGGLVDQGALVEALSTGAISGAGLDDICRDEASVDELRKMPNVVLTPHIGFNTEEALVIKTDGCIENVAAFLRGKPVNVLV